MGNTVESLEIWRAAKELIEQLGEDARIESARRAEEAMEQGDNFTFKVWCRINLAIDRLLAAQSHEGRAASRN